MFADLSLDLSIVWTKHLTGLKFCISNSNKDFMIFSGTISLFPSPGNTGAKCPNLPPKAGKLAWWQPGTLYHDWLELGGCWGREEAELSGLWCWGWAVMDRHQPALSVSTQRRSQSQSDCPELLLMVSWVCPGRPHNSISIRNFPLILKSCCCFIIDTIVIILISWEHN